MEIEKIVVITQPTWLDGLVEKFNTRLQAKFYIEQTGSSFEDYQTQHETYYAGLRKLKSQLPRSIRYQVVDKAFLPSFLFGDNDLVIVFGRDGLVINTAKYLDGQTILAINPNPELNIGILLPFTVDEVASTIENILNKEGNISLISMIKAETNAGQVIYGVNDIFVGQRAHQSSRYTISHNGRSEKQSSSGILISTGMGSTGWYKSIMLSAVKISEHLGIAENTIQEEDLRFDWDSQYLRFCVREPWPSNTTGNDIIYGKITESTPLRIVSHMPEGGTVFGDGIEQDRIQFNSGTILTVSIAERVVRIFTP